MKLFLTQLALLILLGLLSFQSTAAAPVVEESDNYALVDTPSREEPNLSVNQAVNDEEEIALAQEDDSPSSENTASINTLKSLQQDLQELRGQLEIQNHQIAELKKQQIIPYKDLDTRLGNVAVSPTPRAPDDELHLDMSQNTTSTALKKPISYPIPANTMKNNPADEQISYLAAYELVKNKHFDEALQAMQNFVSYYPHGGYTANAYYWLGELYMVKKYYPEAIKQFETVLNQFPASSKSAPSSLKIGYALAASGKEFEAKKRLQQVVKNYPDTPTAQLAFAKLNTLSAS